MIFDYSKISIGDLIQIILIAVFIFQTWYLAKQTNFGKRNSQAILTETWNEQLSKINLSLLWSLGTYVKPDEKEFERFILILNKMHYQFKQKLLRPADFTEYFTVLHGCTKNEEFSKTTIYQENYLRLQNLYDDFNNDIDVIYNFMNMPTTSLYKKFFEANRDTFNVKTEEVLRNWKKTQFQLKLGIWFGIKIQRKKVFKLPPLSS